MRTQICIGLKIGQFGMQATLKDVKFDAGE
jgi:hypothetical protein